MNQTNERLCALAQKGDAAALDSLIAVSYTHRQWPDRNRGSRPPERSGRPPHTSFRDLRGRSTA